MYLTTFDEHYNLARFTKIHGKKSQQLCARFDDKDGNFNFSEIIDSHPSRVSLPTTPYNSSLTIWVLRSAGEDMKKAGDSGVQNDELEEWDYICKFIHST